MILPLWEREVLSFGPKHPVRDKFNEFHFLADIDSFLSELKLNRIPGEKLCEIEAAAKRYAKNVKQTPSDEGVEKARNYLKDNGLLAVPFDKGVGFCVMKKETYEKKLKDFLQAEQFSERKNLTDSVIMKNEKNINKKLLAMKKKDKASEAMYTRLRSTGVQPARPYRLAKVHKPDTPLRPVLSLPGSSYDNLNKALAKYFDEIEGANIETNTQMAREILEKTDLNSDESIISLDVKSLYTNVPLKEAVEIAQRRLFEQVNPPETSRNTMKKLLIFAVSKVHFKCNGLWYVQKDGLAMGASLALVLANLWLKEYEPALKKEVPKLTVLSEGNKEVCPGCQKKATYWTKGVECEACLNWYHLGCGNISESEYADIAETVWYCMTCKKQQEADRTVNGVKVFLRYVDDLVRTVKGDPGAILEAANKLHPNLQFTIEELDSNGNLAFLD